MNLNAQCDRVWRSLKRTSPRSERRAILQRELVKIQAKRLKQEMKGAKK
jgi:hypothetical protein